MKRTLFATCCCAAALCLAGIHDSREFASNGSGTQAAQLLIKQYDAAKPPITFLRLAEKE